MKESTFKYGFTDHAPATGPAHQRHHLGLHIRTKPGIDQRLDGHPVQRAGHVQPHRGFLLGYLRPGLPELRRHRQEMLRNTPLDLHIPSRNRTRHQIGPGFDPIGHNPVSPSIKARHPFDRDRGRADSMDSSTPVGQKDPKVHDFRFHRRIVDDRGPLGEGGRHEQIFGSGHRRDIEVNPGTFQARRPSVDIAVLDLDLRPELLQSPKMEIDRSGPDGTPARQRNRRLPEPGEERPQHQDRGPHGLDQVIRRFGAGRGGGLDHDLITALMNGRPELGQHVSHRLDVADAGNIGDDAFVGSQEGRSQNREGRVFGAADRDLPHERLPTFD